MTLREKMLEIGVTPKAASRRTILSLKNIKWLLKLYHGELIHLES